MNDGLHLWFDGRVVREPDPEWHAVTSVTVPDMAAKGLVTVKVREDGITECTLTDEALRLAQFAD